MDDDGLLINIAKSSASGNGSKKGTVRSKASMKGSWKRRHLAVKAAISRGQKGKIGRSESTTDKLPVTDASGDSNKGPQLKRQAPLPESGADAPPSPKKRKLTATVSVGVGRSKANPQERSAPSSKSTAPDRRGGSKTIVSSLFSSNPTMPESLQVDHDSSARAPNAPLFAGSSFESLGIAPFLSSHVSTKLGLATPTSVQRHSLPLLLNPTGRDLLIQSPTGSGKTLAYLAPIVDSVLKIEGAAARRDRTGVLAVIIAPTRELAGQICDVVGSLVNWGGGKAKESHSALQEEDDDESDSETKGTSAIQSATDPLHRPAHWLTPVLLIGGARRKSEKARLRRGAQILIGTPGRLLDHLRTTAALDVSNVRWLVLDEADRLVEEGLEEDIKECVRILDKMWRGGERKGLSRDWDASLPGRRRIVLCSATVEAGVAKMAGWLMKTKTVVVTETGVKDWVASDAKAGSEAPLPATQSGGFLEKPATSNTSGRLNEAGSLIATPAHLRQLYIPAPYKLRLVALASLLRRASLKGRKCVVFVAAQDVAEWLWKVMTGVIGADVRKNAKEQREEDPDIPTRDSIFLRAPVTKLHGGLTPAARASALKTFVSAQNGVLVSTSLAARGLDVPDVALVVQLDPPHDVEEYVHRVGRTARIGRNGEAVIFISPEEADYVSVLEKRGMLVERMVVETVVVEGLKDWRKQPAKVNSKGFAEWEVNATNLQMMVERATLEDPELLKLSRSAYTAHLRAYSTHPAAQRSIFHLRKLHLGHVAKSFGLRDSPGDISIGGSKAQSATRKKAVPPKKMGLAALARRKAVNEFGDGF
ncbi:DEAD-domain-containing protein [Gonapodya prolifera JEL478]|uniref:ATP-dependent RNA helicase n=1 Tax=Gonapodya prolifera (strain JEL478) TaxID=1344416 RepID=A0A139A4B4_GONPJ|nr:DEAD-domain-containing protein [Gonapodya prolifera JEL478]|eukprot:KXS11630.1 DEAD-domain-containing protein [Gonapodya prolifera JEL478]